MLATSMKNLYPAKTGVKYSFLGHLYPKLKIKSQ